MWPPKQSRQQSPVNKLRDSQRVEFETIITIEGSMQKVSTNKTKHTSNQKETIVHYDQELFIQRPKKLQVPGHEPFSFSSPTGKATPKLQSGSHKLFTCSWTLFSQTQPPTIAPFPLSRRPGTFSPERFPPVFIHETTTQGSTAAARAERAT